MGKSTTAALFRGEGVPVHDSDAAVHRLYAKDGAGARAIGDVAPAAIGDDGVDRRILGRLIREDPPLLKAVESVIHPLVREDREQFARDAAGSGAAMVVFDIPLLFETGGDGEVDKIVVVTAPAAVQRARAMARPGMTEETFGQLLARQTPDAQKRARADYLVDTSAGIEDARRQVIEIIADLNR